MPNDHADDAGNDAAIAESTELDVDAVSSSQRAVVLGSALAGEEQEAAAAAVEDAGQGTETAVVGDDDVGFAPCSKRRRPLLLISIRLNRPQVIHILVRFSQDLQRTNCNAIQKTKLYGLQHRVLKTAATAPPQRKLVDFEYVII
jgi:hypothetical protein